VRIKSLAFRTDVALRVLEGAEVIDRGDYLVIRSLDNPGFWWGNFLLLGAPPGPGTVDTWLARFAAEFPQAHHAALGIDITSAPSAPGAIPGEFAAAGFERQRETVLTATEAGPPPHPNTEAEIRPLDSDADWRQAYELALRCAGQDEHQEYLERRTAARRRLTQAGRGAWFGAFTGGRLLAQLGLFDTGDGYARYQHVETDPRARRQGLAGTLVWHASRYGRETLGASTLVIVADPNDVAIGVYRSCGFTDFQDQVSLERAPAVLRLGASPGKGATARSG
jgi:ribosomal protein S18 acetylase RimI-like enzyme